MTAAEAKRELTAETIAFYGAIAAIYDRLQPLRAWSFEDQIVQRVLALLANRFGAAVSTVDQPTPLSFLDLGCGTGTLLHALRDARPIWRLAGIDATAAMLALARAKTGGESILWARGQIAEPLPYRGGFHAVGAFNDTLTHLPNCEALAATFEAAARVLGPKGLLLFDLTNEAGLEFWSASRHLYAEVDLGDAAVMFDHSYDPATRLGTLGIIRKDATSETRYEVTRRWFSEPEIEQALRAAGFMIEISAPWSPFAKGSPTRTWFVAVPGAGRSRP